MESDEEVRAVSHKKAKSSRVESDESDEEVIRRPKKKSRCTKGSVILDSGKIVDSKR